MSDIMHPLPLTKLFNITFAEYKKYSSIFGIHKDSFYHPENHPHLHFHRYGQLLESPLGVAAGPQTQLAQNIIAAWLTGSRYIELKTVQILDELEVSKPCIDMEDEGYNCEWSQELRLPQSFQEYLHAWIMIHILKHELKIGDPNQIGTIFNMSVGYNLEGILSEKVQKFFNQMENCQSELEQAIDQLRPLYPQIDQLNIPAQITNNITLSTMHGCPPEEIEKIGMYLIKERKLHTTIKLNPTLNGKEDLRYLLNEHLGFTDINVPDIAFEHDLKYSDGIKLIKNLQTAAKKQNVEFSIKLTNTLETENNKDNFDKSNEMMYMSGRPLHVLAINLAAKLQNEFSGNLDITFSAGIDAFNCAPVLETGIKPLTVCTDLLKPGGYERFKQYFYNLDEYFKQHKASSINQLVLANYSSLTEAKQTKIQNYKQQVLKEHRYHKTAFPWKTIKTGRVLSYFDCIAAPCSETCPTNQDIPTYMYLTTTGEYQKALDVIRYSNPFPYTTGLACDHVCEDKCTRINYDESLKIRDIKRFLAFNGERKQAPQLPAKELSTRVAIIGGGPSGLSGAYYLRLAGIQVEIFEAKDILGGMCANTLPDFRMGTEGLKKDIERILALGIKVHENTPIDSVDKFKQLQKDFDYIYIAIGAQKSKELGIENEDCSGVIGHLEFLEKVKRKQITSLPQQVLIIGGGNSAIDAARTAKRLIPEDGDVTIVYRRTPKEMPAAREEIEELSIEGINILELASPERIITKDNRVKQLLVSKMELVPTKRGERASIRKIANSEFTIDADFIIKAIGQEITAPFLTLFKQDHNGRIIALEQRAENNIFVGGDLFHGPKSIIQAVADGKNVAWKILRELNLEHPTYHKPLKGLNREELKAKKRERLFGTPLPAIAPEQRNNFDLVIQTFSEKQAQEEASRCLLCDELCDSCVTVCPNRANIGYEQEAVEYILSDLQIDNQQARQLAPYQFKIQQEFQTLNIGDFCNECGNCATFCPTAGRPYVDKPKVYLSKDTFMAEKDNAFYFTNNVLHAKLDGNYYQLTRNNNLLEVKINNDGTIILDEQDLSLVSIDYSKEGVIKLDKIAQANMLFNFFQEHPYWQD